MKQIVVHVVFLIGLFLFSPTVASCSGKTHKTYDHGKGQNPGGNEEPSANKPPANMPGGNYRLLVDQPGQTIEGLGFEIQSDDFSSTYENDDPKFGVPWDLVPEERTRLAKEMLTGFRYMRVAMGIWYRGISDDRKNFKERYPEQTSTLLQLIKDAGVEGISMEYWSPAPYWKSNNNLYNGTLKSFDNAFLEEFTDALAQDLRFMKEQGFKVSTWGLQNESQYTEVNYAHCHYPKEQLVKVFGMAAPKIRAVDSSIEIIYDTNSGNAGDYGQELWEKNPQLLQYVDAWVYHRIGDDSDLVMNRRANYLANNQGKPIYQNEYEYFLDQVDKKPREWRMVNTAQSIMNWMTFIQSPKWYWLHALKPISDLNREGFGLGVYRPSAENRGLDYPNLKKGHFVYEWSNYNAIAGFLKYMPWDSKRYNVTEDEERANNRIMAWKKPDGKYVIAVTNRSDDWFEFKITLDKGRSFSGHRYNEKGTNQDLEKQQNTSNLSAKVKPWSIDFWVEE